MLVLEDVTRQREPDKIKSDFVAVIGHELRTPLTVIRGYVQMLNVKGTQLDAASLDTCLTALTTNTGRLERLIDDLLFVSSIDTRRPALDLQRVDVADVLDEFAGPRVHIETPGRRVALEIDRSKFDQVLGQLIDNALKFSDDEVVVSLVEGDGEIEIHVDDNGAGIFSGDIPNLFERFRQLDGTSTRAKGGTGVGLYICRRLVELQGGRIWCDSRLSVGSRFAFTLPTTRPSCRTSRVDTAPPVAPSVG